MGNRKCKTSGDAYFSVTDRSASHKREVKRALNRAGITLVHAAPYALHHKGEAENFLLANEARVAEAIDPQSGDGPSVLASAGEKKPSTKRSQ